MLTNSYPRNVKCNRRWASQVAWHMRQMSPQPPYLPPHAHGWVTPRAGQRGQSRSARGPAGPGLTAVAAAAGPPGGAGSAHGPHGAPHGAPGQARPAPAAGLRATGSSTPCLGQTRPRPGPENRHRSNRRACDYLRGREHAGRGSRRAPPRPSGPAYIHRRPQRRARQPRTARHRGTPPSPSPPQSRSRPRPRPCPRCGPLRPAQGDARSRGFTFAACGEPPHSLRGARAGAPGPPCSCGGGRTRPHRSVSPAPPRPARAQAPPPPPPRGARSPARPAQRTARTERLPQQTCGSPRLAAPRAAA